jgi:glycosyltransferase involved in cell wall biosynthesis
MMKVAFHLSKRLSRVHQVFCANARESIFAFGFWKKIKKSQPEIVHIILRPSIVTLALAQFVKSYCNTTKVLMSALQPPRYLAEAIFSLVKPDLILIQSIQTQQIFIKFGYKTAFLPNGVDVKRFHPVSKSVKMKLRKKYSINEEKFVALHIGHILKGRNLEILNEIMEERDNQVIIVGSNVFKLNKQVYTSLMEHGCIVWQKHFPSIEEIYQLADCYVFPVVNSSSCIDLPLSVMEAMACNLPVLSTRFGGLPQTFSEGDGLAFINGPAGLIDKLHILKQDLRECSIDIRTREKVLPYSWKNVSARLEEIYAGAATSA